MEDPDINQIGVFQLSCEWVSTRPRCTELHAGRNLLDRASLKNGKDIFRGEGFALSPKN